VGHEFATCTTLQSNYNTLLTQITQLASDSGYNGINLLAGDNLTIDFNSNGAVAASAFSDPSDRPTNVCPISFKDA
jgi:flagellin-like hook-associated protein FlgL